jgi:hypothetical protein
MECCGGFTVTSDLMKDYLGHRKGTDDEVIGFPKSLMFELFAKFE